MSEILVTKPGTLSASDKRTLRKAGVVPIEADNPADVRLLNVEGSALSGDDMLFAVLSALSSSESLSINARAKLPSIMLKLLKERREQEDAQ